MRFVKKSVKRKANFDINDLDIVQYAKKCIMPIDSFVNKRHPELIYDHYLGEKYIRYEQGDHNEKRTDLFIQEMCLFFEESFLGIKRPEIQEDWVQIKQGSKRIASCFGSNQSKKKLLRKTYNRAKIITQNNQSEIRLSLYENQIQLLHEYQNSVKVVECKKSSKTMEISEKQVEKELQSNSRIEKQVVQYEHKLCLQQVIPLMKEEESDDQLQHKPYLQQVTPLMKEEQSDDQLANQTPMDSLVQQSQLQEYQYQDNEQQ